jgi:hypothetical protein
MNIGGAIGSKNEAIRMERDDQGSIDFPQMWRPTQSNEVRKIKMLFFLMIFYTNFQNFIVWMYRMFSPLSIN